MNLKQLPKEIQNIIIASYEIGYTNRDCKLIPYNNFVANEEKIEYIEAILSPEKEECQLELIDSVS